jgi:sugar/nucleoside kinase (ribokinase family)
MHFVQFAAIDWSGAKGSKHKGIAVALCGKNENAPELVPASNRYWSRREVADWVLAQASKAATLFGFDFSFAPPLIERSAYLPGENIPTTARAFWAYVDHVCEDEDLGAASLLEHLHRRHFYFGKADGIKADYMHLRRCEAHYNAGGGGKPSTVYDAIGAGQVAKASFAGMRLLHYLNQHLPIWPFDALPDGGSAIVEIYTSIAARAAGRPKGRTKIRDATTLNAALAAIGSSPHRPLAAYDDHATDAILTAAWLRRSAPDSLYWSPPALTEKIACTEGWTFGVI